MTFDPRHRAIADIKTELLFDMVVDLNRALVSGDGGLGRRVLFGSAGGSFEGPRLRGEVLPGAGGRGGLFNISADGGISAVPLPSPSAGF